MEKTDGIVRHERHRNGFYVMIQHLYGSKTYSGAAGKRTDS
jgi:hypothetical protein